MKHLMVSVEQHRGPRGRGDDLDLGHEDGGLLPVSHGSCVGSAGYS